MKFHIIFHIINKVDILRKKQDKHDDNMIIIFIYDRIMIII